MPSCRWLDHRSLCSNRPTHVGHKDAYLGVFQFPLPDTTAARVIKSGDAPREARLVCVAIEVTLYRMDAAMSSPIGKKHGL